MREVGFEFHCCFSDGIISPFRMFIRDGPRVKFSVLSMDNLLRHLTSLGKYRKLLYDGVVKID